jgi:Peptidase family M23
MITTSTTLKSAFVAILVCASPCAAQIRLPVILRPPISSACISSPFGPRVLPNEPQAGSYHYGIDLPAPAGAPVLATAPGTVIRIQRKGPGGLEMLVQHDGFVGIYSHFGMVMPAFAEGKRTVAAGEKLGVVGNTGLTTGAHLYFEMDLAGKPVDPAPYLGVSQCNGEVHQASKDSHHASNARSDIEGEIIGGRKYYVIFPTGQDYQRQQH